MNKTTFTYWIDTLVSGDEVQWTDGKESKKGFLSKIEFLGKNKAKIEFSDGWKKEVFLTELS